VGAGDPDQAGKSPQGRHQIAAAGSSPSTSNVRSRGSQDGRQGHRQD
jgi:hypothetical protein